VPRIDKKGEEGGRKVSFKRGRKEGGGGEHVAQFFLFFFLLGPSREGKGRKGKEKEP